MSKSNVHFDENGNLVGFGSYESDNFISVDDIESILEAYRVKKTIKRVGADLVITDSRAEKLREIRVQRDFLLTKSDVELMKLEDAELISGVKDVERRQALAVYRQALRDITLQDLDNVTFPELI